MFTFKKRSWGFLESAIVVVVALFLVVGVTFAASTIGSSISTTGNLTVSGTSTTTAIWVGAAGTANNLDLSNDAYIQDDVEVDGTIYGVDAILTSKATSTAGLVVAGETTTGTTTVQIKADTTGGNGSSCLEMVNVEGVTYRIFINGAGAVTAQAGTCK